MIILLSPAKSLDFSNQGLKEYSEPVMLDQANRLIGFLKKKSPNKLKKLMSISDDLAKLNAERYQSFSEIQSPKNSRQAIFAFQGDVYRGLNATDFDRNDLEFAQQHLRILSGLYGILKPLDLMQPYRLEMGTRLKTRRGENLYKFWGNRITQRLNEEIENGKENVFINLASKEYFSSIKPKLLNGRVYHINFKEYRNGQLKFLSFNAKKARGLMTRYIIKNRIETLDKIKEFNTESYQFDPELSDESNWTFTR